MSFGGAVKLTGESEYRKALKAIQQELKETGSAMKLVSSEFGKNDTSIAGLSSKYDAYSKTLLTQQNKIDTLKNHYSDISAQYDENKKNHDKLVSSYEDEKQKLDKIASTLGESSSEYQKQSGVVDKMSAAVYRSNTALSQNESAMSKTRTELNNAQASFNKTQREIEQLSSELKSAKNPFEQFQNAMSEATQAADSASNGGFTTLKGTVANLTSDVIMRATDAVKDLAVETVKAGMNFEAAISKVAAVSGAGNEEIVKLTDKAKEMGAATKFTATESAEAFNYMAMAGWKTDDMLSGISGIMSLAAAAGADLATTSDIVTDALTAMGYSAGDSTRLADVMAAASSNANTNVELMGATFQYFAPIVGALGYSMEDAAVAIGLVANAGIKGEKAGTALRGIFSRLAAPTDETAAAMEKLGISLTDSDGKTKSMASVVEQLRKSMSGLSETEQTQYAKNLAGQEAMTSLLAIVNAGESDYNKLTTAVANSNGAAQQMSDTMLDNTKGSWTLFQSKVEGVQIALEEKAAPAFNTAIDAASDLVDSVDWDDFGDDIGDALEKGIEGLEWIIDHKGTIVGGMKAIVGAFVVKKLWDWTSGMSSVGKAFISSVASSLAATAAVNTNTVAEVANTGAKVTGTAATGTLTVAQAALNTVMSANPVGLVVLALGALAAVTIGLISNANELTESEKAYNEALDEKRKKIQEQKDAWDELKEAQQKQIEVTMTETNSYSSLFDELSTLIDKNGKVKEGYEERAKFIEDTLFDNLDTEHQKTGDLVTDYKNLATNIEKVIEKKRAQAILDGQYTLYKEAVSQYGNTDNDMKAAKNEINAKGKALTAALAELTALDAEFARRKNSNSPMLDYEYEDRKYRFEQTIEQREKELDDAKETYAQLEEIAAEYAYNIGIYEENEKLAHAGKYDEMTTVTWNYVREYQGAGEAQKAELEDRIESERIHLNFLKKQKEKYNTDIYDQQIIASEKQLKLLKKDLKQYTATTESGLNDTHLKWSEGLDGILSKITGEDITFKETGRRGVQMYVNGVKSGEPLSKNAMARIVSSTLLETSKKETDSYDSGKNFILSWNKGAGSVAQSVIKNIAIFGGNLLTALKGALDEHSPSRATEEIFVNLFKSFGNVAVKKQMTSTIIDLQHYGKNVIGSLNKELAVGATLGEIDITTAARMANNELYKNLPTSSGSVSSSNNDIRKQSDSTAKIQVTVTFGDVTINSDNDINEFAKKVAVAVENSITQQIFNKDGAFS